MTQDVRITGGTFFIGLMLFVLIVQSSAVLDRLREIRDRLPEKVAATSSVNPSEKLLVRVRISSSNVQSIPRGE